MTTDPINLLANYTKGALSAMATAWGVDDRANKSQLVKNLAAVVFDPERINAARARLSPVPRVLLEMLQLSGGSAGYTMLRTRLAARGLVDQWVAPPPKPGVPPIQPPAGQPHQVSTRYFPDVVADLGASGLAFVEGITTYGSTVLDLGGPAERVVIPAEVLALLPPVTYPIVTTSEPPTTRLADQSAFFRDVYVFLSAARQEPIQLIAKGLIGKKHLSRLNDSFSTRENVALAKSEDDLRRLPWLRALLEQMRLLYARGGALHLDDNAEAFLAKPRAERLGLLVDAYRQTDRWVELFRLKDDFLIQYNGAVKAADPSFAEARRRVMAELGTLPANEWVAFEHFVERLKVLAYDFLLSRQPSRSRYYYGSFSYGYGVSASGLVNPYVGNNPMGWTFNQPGGDYYGRTITDEAVGWDIVELSLIRHIVAEAAHWLGLVDLGFANDKLTAIRVTTVGRQALQGEPIEPTPTKPYVVIQPNFQVLAMEPTADSVLFQLDRIAERVKIDQAVEYKITRESVIRAQKQGTAVADIITFLSDISATPLPQNVRRSLEDWGSLLDRIVIRPHIALAQTADAELLDGLYIDDTVRPLLGRRLGPTYAQVAPANLRALARNLLERGQLPALTEGENPLIGTRLRVDANGRVEFAARSPNLFALAEVREFTDVDDQGALRITPGSLRRAARAGSKPETIVEVLTMFAGDETPVEAIALVQRWTKDWGDGALVTGTVLQVESAETLKALLADPEVARYLRAVPNTQTFAVVRADGVETVRRALTERGMALTDQFFR